MFSVFFRENGEYIKLDGPSSILHENSPIFLLVPLEVYMKPHATLPRILSKLLFFGTPYYAPKKKSHIVSLKIIQQQKFIRYIFD